MPPHASISDSDSCRLVLTWEPHFVPATPTDFSCPLYVTVLRGELPSPGDVILLCLSTNTPPPPPYLVCVCSSWSVLLRICSRVPAAALRSSSDAFSTTRGPRCTSDLYISTFHSLRLSSLQSFLFLFFFFRSAICLEGSFSVGRRHHSHAVF